MLEGVVLFQSSGLTQLWGLLAALIMSFSGRVPEDGW